MSSNSSEALRNEINAMPWFHQIDFGNGILSPGDIKLGKIKRNAGIVFNMPLTGKTVLDIGCWDGAYSLEATRRGAKRVLGVDHFVWHHAGAGDRRAIELVRQHLAPTIEVQDIDIPDLSVETVGNFDIVLFCGVFYHLRHPFEALERIARIATECLVLETHLVGLFSRRPFMRFYPGSELSNDPTNWWSPNRACVEAMLRDVGFKKIAFRHPDYRMRRGIFHAWR
jgi:tRNA (mo5U34)-methyltransferase